MKVTYTGWLAVLLLIGLLWPTVSQATHVRAGVITTRRIPSANSQLTYEVTLTVYYDEVNGRLAAQQTPTVDMCFGDGSVATVARQTPIQLINGGTSSINIYRTTHTYPAPEAYKISARIRNRNDNTRNINGGNSIDIPFYVATTISVNANLGPNSTPVLLNAPLDSGRVGQKFCYNPAAFDADGDSLAYRSVGVVPAQSTDNNPCQQLDVPGYRYPDAYSTSSEAGGGATYGVNTRTGDLCWDAPGQVGQYNMAFIIEEWRNGVLIGEITVDLQIIVVDSPNKRPLITPLPDLCVEAGTTINQTISATDPDGNRLIISAYGGPFNRGADGKPATLVAPNPATFTTPPQAQPQPGTGTLSWQTNCSHVRQEPYEVVFKVTDQPTNRATALSSFQSLRITVYGASPKNLTARPATSTGGRAIQLNWTPYTCLPTSTSAQPTADTTRIIIYRKEGCSSADAGACVTGIPSGQGYTEVGRVPVTASSFIDAQNLRRGVSYSYRIVVLYPQSTGGGVSVASSQVCYSLPSLAPLLTTVTVDSTGPGLTPSVSRGVITVRWTRPLGLNPGDLGAPYQYRLLRAQGLNATSFSPVLTRTTSLDPALADTVFTDRSGLNTLANAYTYQLEFYYTDPAGQLTRLDATDPATSVRLAASPANRRIQLSWQAVTPWSNDNQTHRVFRSTTGPNGPFNQIAAVAVSGAASYSYTDTGVDQVLADGNTSLSALSADSTYCYWVETVGQYADPSLHLGLLTNRSQILCAQPADTTRPCAPTLRVDSLNCSSLSPESLCNQSSFTNRLNWVAGAGAGCDAAIAGYRIYYSPYTDSPSSVSVGSVSAPTLSFGHESLSTVAGCYYVTAVNRRGLESGASNRVCVESCPYFMLPNVFTPNGDGRNDVFVPLRCPRFVESVVFVVVNRWGAEVYRTTDAGINWSGVASNGQPLPGGLYYYQATVRFSSVARNAGPVVYKGWVELIRQAGTN